MTSPAFGVFRCERWSGNIKGHDGGPHKGLQRALLCPWVIGGHQRDMGDTKKHLKGSALFSVCPGCGSDMLFPGGPIPASSSASLAG